MKTLLPLFILISMNLFAQKKMVLIEGFQGHQIEVQDELSSKTVKEFFWWARRAKFPYHERLQEIKAVSVVPMGSYRNHHFHNGVIYIAEYANKFPNIKRILILNELAYFYGLPESDVIPLDDYNEELYRIRRKYFKDLKRIINELKTSKP